MGSHQKTKIVDEFVEFVYEKNNPINNGDKNQDE